jgi:hypothetical protein
VRRKGGEYFGIILPLHERLMNAVLNTDEKNPHFNNHPQRGWFSFGSEEGFFIKALPADSVWFQGKISLKPLWELHADGIVRLIRFGNGVVGIQGAGQCKRRNGVDREE